MGAPNLPLLEYDGGCGICTRTARWVEQRLPEGSGVSVEPWQRLDLRAVGLSPTDVADYAWWIAPGGVRRRGHRAIAAVFRTIGGPWGVVGRLIDLPPISWVAAAVYAVVARNRHRLSRFGITPTCADGGCEPPRSVAAARTAAPPAQTAVADASRSGFAGRRSCERGARMAPERADVSVEPGLVGQAEDALADDVALDLAGPAADGQGG